MYKLRFSHFWDGFDKEDNLFLELINEIHPEVQVVESEFSEIDLEITSTFSSTHQYLFKKIVKIMTSQNGSRLNDKDFFRDTNMLRLHSKSKRRIWFTGENIRPPIDSRIDQYLSFDQDEYEGRNIYFPLWQLYFRKKLSIYESPQLGECFQTSNFMNLRERTSIPTKFVCAFISNMDPYRIRAIEALRAYGEVDLYGKRFGKFVQNKKEVAKDYKFVLAFENDYFPGYVTEKLFDAYACNSIPLYWGDFGNESLINKEAFINAANFSKLAEFAKKVGEMPDSEWLTLYRKPLLKSLPDFQKIRELIAGGYS